MSTAINKTGASADGWRHGGGYCARIVAPLKRFASNPRMTTKGQRLTHVIASSRLANTAQKLTERQYQAASLAAQFERPKEPTCKGPLPTPSHSFWKEMQR